jgi:hypothetical protein
MKIYTDIYGKFLIVVYITIIFYWIVFFSSNQVKRENYVKLLESYSGIPNMCRM